MSCWDEGLPKKYLKTHMVYMSEFVSWNFWSAKGILKIYCRELSKTLGFGKIQPLWCHQVYLSLETFLAVSPNSSEAWIFQRLLPDKIYTKILGHDLKDTLWKKVRVCNPEGPDTAQNAHFQLFYFIHNKMCCQFSISHFWRTLCSARSLPAALCCSSVLLSGLAATEIGKA